MKGSPTIIAEPGGNCYFNQTGNEGMASGGSGDVLSGIIGSFLAGGCPTIDAAIAGVFVHGLAGDLAAEQITPRAMIASDQIRFLPEAFKILGE
ncbi:MAG: NAD(P)H-hydrate dehydratase [candidate division Zixibacteria bacterium]